MLNNKMLKKKIMNRVYAIWFFRKVAPAMFLYVPFLVFVALREASREFFVVRIFDNFLTVLHSSGFSGAVQFVFSALANTPVLPTLIISASFVLSGLILRRLFKNFMQVTLVEGF